MKNRVFLLSLVALQIILWGCSGTSAPDTLLAAKVAVKYSNGVLYFPKSNGPTLRKFIASINPGKWEKIDNNQWIYRVKTTDAVTRKDSEISILFVRHPNQQDVVVFHRVAANGSDMSSEEKDYLYNQWVLPLVKAD